MNCSCCPSALHHDNRLNRKLSTVDNSLNVLPTRHELYRGHLHTETKSPAAGRNSIHKRKRKRDNYLLSQIHVFPVLAVSGSHYTRARTQHFPTARACCPGRAFPSLRQHAHASRFFKKKGGGEHTHITTHAI